MKNWKRKANPKIFFPVQKIVLMLLIKKRKIKKQI